MADEVRIIDDVETTFEQVLSDFSAYIKKVASVHARTARSLGLTTEDLEQAGAVGLWEAWRRYDPSLGMVFLPYARKRVRGAMIDLIRSCGHFKRSCVQRRNEYELVHSELWRELGREPTHEEMMAALGVGDAVYASRLESISFSVVSADQGAVGEEGGMSPLLPREQPTPEDIFYEKELVEIVRRALFAVLSARELRLVIMYYYNDMSMSEIASALRLTESRVSQILVSARRKLLRYLSRHLSADDLGFVSPLMSEMLHGGLTIGARRTLVSF